MLVAPYLIRTAVFQQCDKRFSQVVGCNEANFGGIAV